MDLQEFAALLTLAVATSFTPGPNTTLSATLAANSGLRRALRFVVAVPVGWGLLLSACAAGLGALIIEMPLLHLTIKAVGIVYLLWLAWRLSRASQLFITRESRLSVTFWQGIMLQFVNIKAWMLAVTITAGWIAGKDDAMQRFLFVLPVLLSSALLSNFLYAVIGSLLRQWLAHGQRLLIFNRTMSLLLMCACAWMVVA